RGGVRLPFDPPIAPMLAKPADALPEGDGWLFEPKWDGFRALVFRDGDETLIQSRDLKPLDRYFPELGEPLRASLPPRCVVDGEVVIAGDGGLEFEALLLRIHPAASRVRMLAEQSPASYVAWDLLALDDAGKLHHVGVTSSFSWDGRAALAKELEPLRENALEGHPWGEWAEWAALGAADASGQRLPGATSRWNRGKDLSWEPLRVERVAEVAYDHLQGDRFRHGTTFVRWRPDKQPEACRYDQLEET